MSLSPLEVDWLIVRVHRSLLERLGQSGMSVAGAGNILGAGTVLDGDDCLGNHLPGVRADDVSAEDPVGFLIGQDLNKSLRTAVGPGAGVGGEGEGTNAVRDACLLELFLGLADGGNLGIGVDNAGDGVVVDVAGVAGNGFHGGNALLLGLVSEHGSIDAVPDGIDGRDGSAEVLIDLDPSELIGLNPQRVQTKVFGIRSTSGGNQNYIILGLLLLPTLAGLGLKDDAVILNLALYHLRLELELKSLLLERCLELLG
mmetsp:Transcript_25000/g.54508  ORF Transcript_25000/g.54508 Transcript_25000/m.54508 type:complete len:257 (-) Transcript_25000:1017-1787(-)